MLVQLRKRINSCSNLFIGGLIIAALLGPLALHVYNSFKNINSWSITEWLISYDGGFVRRGIGGELVKILSIDLNLAPTSIIITISILAWIILIFFIFRISKGVIPNYILLSPIFFGMPVYSDFLVRKDVLGVLLLAFSLFVIKNFSGLQKYVLVNILIILALLNHESVIFFGIPLIIITEIIYTKGINWFRAVLPYYPCFLTAAVVLIFKGGEESANAIAVFWNSFFNENYPGFCCLSERPAAIDAIGWTTARGLSLSLGLLNDFVNGIIYVPAAWILTIFICLQLGSWALGKHEGRRFVAIFLVQLFFVSPLFLLGWDLGRWIFFVTASSLIWILLFKEATLQQRHLDRLVDLLNVRPLLTQKEVGLVTLIFGIPGCCWSLGGFILSTPLGDNLYFFYKILKLFN